VRLVRADVGLEAACIDLGGWDTHFVQNTVYGERVAILARGLAALDAATQDADVTTVVITEFGRRTYENGSAGTDHGRGYAMIVMGSRVHGGKVYGEWPGLDMEDFTAGPGGLPVRIDYREVLAEVAGSVANDVFPALAPKPLGVL